ELFAAWRQRLPQTRDQVKAIKETGIRPPLDGSSDGPTAFVTWVEAPKDVQWFAVPPNESGMENVQTSSEGDVSKLTSQLTSTLTFSLSPAPKEPAQMQFLVAFTDLNGKRQGVEFGVKLPPVAK
ncbi:MAG: hypothetical protein ABIP55_04110, partial [Tepidisphaeraceae bacterium]